MPINVTPRQVQVKVYKLQGDSTGLDVSELLDGSNGWLTGSWTKLDYSGLKPFTGTLVLRQRIGFTESLDDRENPSRWGRGNRVLVDVAADSGVLQRYLSLRILGSEYEPIERRLTLQVGCLLALNDYREPPDDKSGVEVGVGKTRTQIINSLLAAAQCPQISSGPTDTINFPLPRFSGSYVQQAGLVAAAAGYTLWVDQSEAIQCLPLNLAPETILTTHNLKTELVAYERTQGSEKPAEVVRCIGTTKLQKAVPNPLVIVEEKYITKGRLAPMLYPGSQELTLYERTTTTTTWDEVQKLETTEVQIDRAKINSHAWIGPENRTAGVKYSAAVSLFSLTTTKRYFDADGILKRVEEQEDRPANIWYADADEGDQIVTGRKQYSEYFYTDGIIRRKVSEKSIFNLAILSGYGIGGIFTSFDLKPFLRTTETWEEIVANTPDGWRHTTVYEQNKITQQGYNPWLINTLGTGIGEITDDADEPNWVQTGGNSTRGKEAQPPATEYQPPRFEEEDQELIGEALFTPLSDAFYRERIREYRVEYATSEAMLDQRAEERGAVLFGREKGQQVTFAFSDALLNWRPYARHDVNEGSKTQAFILDGESIVLSQRRALIVSDSIWIGTVGSLIPPYRARISDTAGFGLGSVDKILNYAPSNVLVIDSAGLGLGAVETVPEAVNDLAGFGLGSLEPLPVIMSYSPTSGQTGTAVTITGQWFLGATQVDFNGAIATYTVDSNTQISTTVPSQATDGPITVTTLAGSGSL